MKYRPEQYAQALFYALEGKSETEQKRIVKQFAAMLARHQATAKARAIFAAYEKLSLKKQRVRSVRLETASPATDQIKKEIRASLGKNIHITEVVNKDILGGAKILIDDEILIDGSVRTQIEELFKKKQ